MAEKEGFEPSRQLPQPTPLAGEPLEPLGYFSRPIKLWRLAEREGFEPPVPCGITGFQDQLHKPLGHLSLIGTLLIIAKQPNPVKQRRCKLKASFRVGHEGAIYKEVNASAGKIIECLQHSLGDFIDLPLALCYTFPQSHIA